MASARTQEQVQAKYAALARNEVPLRDFVPFNSQISDRVVKNSDGALLVTWKVDGLAFETSDPLDLNLRHQAFNQMLRGLPYGSAIWAHRIRRKTTASLSGAYEEFFAQDMADRYYQGFDGYNMMVNELYLTYVFRPEYTMLGKKNRQRLGSDLEAIKRREQKTLVEIGEVMSLIEASLKAYDLTPLKCFEENGTTFSEQLSFYGFLLNGEWKKVAVRTMPIRNYLATSRLFFGGERIEIRAADSSKYAGIMDLQDYPRDTEAGSLDGLLYAPYEYVETQSFTVLAKSQAKEAIERQRKQLTSTEDVAASQAAALEIALDELVDGAFVYGEYHYSLAVFGDSPAEVGTNLAKARAELNEESFQAAMVDLVADAAWFAQMPGNWRYRTRSANLTSLNFAGLSAFHNFSVGKRDGNPWGEAVTILKTPNDSPFFFNWHGTPEDEDSTDKKAPANTTIIGMTGSGKTVLELFLLTMSLKYQPTVFFLDKDRGAEIAIRLMGGNYRCLKRGVPTGFNPFQWPKTPQNIRFIEQLVTSLVPRNLTPTEQADLNRAINTTVNFESIEHRRLSVMRQQLHDMSEDSVRAHLNKWCADDNGHLAWVLDNPVDTIDLTQGRLFGFDNTDVLNDPEVLSPIAQCELHLAESLMDGRRFMYVMAEFWRILQLPAFTAFAADKQYTIRKLNGMGIFDTQSPAQIPDELCSAMVEQSATQIFLPNPKADRKDYVDRFKLTTAEFNLIQKFGESSRLCLIKQGQKSVIARLDLSGLGRDILDILSTSLDNVDILDQVRADVGDAPEAWLPIFKQRLSERRSA